MGMSSLQNLYLQKNGFTGTLPGVWFSSPDAWSKLTMLDLRWNNLQGPIPEPSHGSNFKIDREKFPRIYAEPMNPGFGMCGTVPQDGPRVLRLDRENLETNMPDGDGLRDFSQPCSKNGERSEGPWSTSVLSSTTCLH